MSVAAKKWTPPAGARQLFPPGAIAAVKKWPTIQPEVPEEVTNRVIKKEHIAKFAIAEGGSYDLLAKLGIAKSIPKPQPVAAPTPKPAEPSYDEFRDKPKEQRPSGFNLLANVGTGDKSVLTKRVAPVVSTAFKNPIQVQPKEETPAAAASIPAWKQKILERKGTVGSVGTPTKPATTTTTSSAPPSQPARPAAKTTTVVTPTPAQVVTPTPAAPAVTSTSTPTPTPTLAPAPTPTPAVASTPSPTPAPEPTVASAPIVSAPEPTPTVASTPVVASTPSPTSITTPAATPAPAPATVTTTTTTTTITTSTVTPKTTSVVSSTTTTSRNSVISRWQPKIEETTKPLIKINTTSAARTAANSATTPATATPAVTAKKSPEPAATPATTPAATPVAASTDGPKQLYPLEELVKKPAGVNMAILEQYLLPEDYPKAFKVTVDEFKKLPFWKQKQLKMAAKLF